MFSQLNCKIVVNWPQSFHLHLHSTKKLKQKPKMNATVGKAIFNAYFFFYINTFFVFYNGLKEGSVSLNKCITPNRWVNSGLLLKSSVNPTHTQTISNTHRAPPFVRFESLWCSWVHWDQMQLWASFYSWDCRPHEACAFFCWHQERLYKSEGSFTVVFVQHRIGQEPHYISKSIHSSIQTEFRCSKHFSGC